MTSLSIYTTNTNDTLLTTARTLVTGTGAASTNHFDSKCGTSTGYSELFSQGTTNAWQALGAVGSPSGHGFLLDATTLEGQTIAAGSWTTRVRAVCSVGTLAVDMYVRAYKRSSGGVYTQIGSTMSLTGQTITTASTNFDFAAASLPSIAFNTGDKLYIDVWLHINTNSTGSSTATVGIVEAVSSTQGSLASVKIDTPGYAATGGGGGGGGGGSSNDNYGITIGVSAASGSLNAAAITDMTNLGITWLRYQCPWSTVDTSGTTAQVASGYTWTAWDSAVSQCNTAGINIILTIFKAPSQFQTGSNPDAPSFAATFASQIASRYNGGAHGTIQGIEMGNEDYDNSAGTSATPLVATLNSVYPAVKAVNSSMIVGSACLLQRNSTHYTNFMETLLNPSTGAYVSSVFQADYLNFHYYTGIPTSGGVPVSLDPTVDIPSWNGGQGLPSVTHAWNLIQAKMSQYGVSVPIWMTESGFQINTNPGRNAAATVSQATQWTYTQDVLDSLRQSNVVTKWFGFTLGYFDGYTANSGNAAYVRDGMSLVQGTLASPVYTVAYNQLKSYITTFPSWGTSSGSGGGTLSATPANVSFSAVAGGSNPSNQSVTVTNSDTSSASYTVTDSAAWLTVSPTSGTIGASSQITSTFSVDITGLAAGTYTGLVTYTAGTNTAQVTVTLVVSSSGSGGGSSGTTPLTAYFSAIPSPITPTANKVFVTAGTPGNVNNATQLGTATGWGEVFAQGTTAAWAAAGAIGSPSGQGFLWGAKTLESNSLQIGTYTAQIRLNMIGTGAAAITADIHCRAYLWNATNGYTAIGDGALTAQTIGLTKAVFSPSFTTTSTTDFGNGDKLYIDIWLNVTANTGASTTQVNLSDLSTDNTTFLGMSTACLATPGYALTVTGGGGGGGGGGGTGANVAIIGGQNVMMLANSLSIEQAVGRRSQASFLAMTDTSTHFQQYEQVQIFDADGNLAFNGYVLQPQETKPGFQDILIQSITCCDQHYLADKRVIAAAYTNRTVGYMVNDIVTNYLTAEGVTVGMITDPGITIPSAIFAYSTVAEALDALAKGASSAGIPYYWMIDSGKLLWFVPYTAIVNSTVVDGTNVDDGRLSGITPSITRANPTYRNTQYILGGMAQTATQTNIRPGDGNTTAWVMDYELSTVPTVSTNLNGAGYVTKTVGILGVDTGKDFYWNKGSNTITQDSSGTKLRGSPTLDLLKVVYTGQFPTVINDQNAGQIAYQASLDGTSGIVEEVENDTTLTSLAGGLAEASQLLTRYATQGTIFEFGTLDSSFAPGQLFTANYVPFNLLNVQMLVESVTSSDQQDGFNIWNDVKAVMGPYDVTWVDFFSTLLASQVPVNSINIGTGQSVLLSASGTASITPSFTGSAAPFACPLPSSSLFPSVSLFPC